MTPLPHFSDFFQALWGRDREPFPWQTMLAERVAEGAWPAAIDLPTASGKTACIEIALYALAAQAGRATSERTAPRRVWFVVDRRIVVDEAFDRATEVAKKLGQAAGGPLRAVADRLCEIAGTKRPLGVARLRGGVLRDDGWARLPSQPAVITSTVDQLGSRLLFRGYGRSSLAAPIFAGLAGNDSLILLDEAHCSVPFMQTLRAVQDYRGKRWAAAPIPLPFSFVIMSATPPADVEPGAVFPGSHRDVALDHPVLRARLEASKQATLVQVPAKAAKGRVGDPLVADAVRRVKTFVDDGKRRVGVIVNRVDTAASLHGALAVDLSDAANTVLMTGRMRPLDRDALVDEWKPYLRAASPKVPARPIVLVATQCLEVGADFSFDALVAEAASLDALRQRFGRLNRMGAPGLSKAAVLIREEDADPDKSDVDPIYGRALAATWKLLEESARDHVVDFGIQALASALDGIDDLADFVAPASDAPVLLPAHLDLLCQTAPRPEPEPEPSLFLHGKDRGATELRVLWRADLDERQSDDVWLETLALCPPLSAEMLSVPLHRFRSAFSGTGAGDAIYDVEGVPARDDRVENASGRWLVWRGRDRSTVVRALKEVRPGDVVVLPAGRGISGLGQLSVEGVGASMLDIWERALQSAERPAAVRISRALLEPWLDLARVEALVEIAESPDRTASDLWDAVDTLLGHPTEEDGTGATVPLPGWWLAALEHVRGGRIDEHPAGGVVLAERAKMRVAAEPDLFADDDDLTSWRGEAQSLDEHSDRVRRTVAEHIAQRCVPEEYRPLLSLAAYWHDVGKLDERFQILLHNGDELRAASTDAPLAKSEQIPLSPARRRFIREASGLPSGFRHEMLSTQLAAGHAALPEDPLARDLILHLVASHHGHARPFAPITEDPQPPAIGGRLGTTVISLSAEERARLVPAHRVDSGIADRFWRLTRRHGWWGLAYLEALIRLGDWYASGTSSNADAGGVADT